MPLEPLNIAVIGAGIGRAHIEGYLGAGANILALCDLNTTKANELAARFDITPQIVTDYQTLLENPSLDAVSICTPNSLHARMACEFLEAGKHVLCEKPLASNAEDAQKIADCARANGRICMVGQVLRFRDDVRALKEKASEIGTIYYARTMARRCQGIPKWGGWFTRKELAGGGPLLDTGVHILDLAWWLAGCPAPLSASGVTYAALGPRKLGLGAGGPADENGVFNVEDLAAGMVRFEGGLTVHFEASWAIRAESDSRFCHLHGTDGALIWNDEPKVIAADGTIGALAVGAGTPWKNEMEHFLECIRENRTPDPDATQGVTMMKILDALYESAAIGSDVKIN